MSCESEPVEVRVAGAASLPLANLRDLGGLPVAGGTVRAAVLWRSDDVSVAPGAELEALWDLGVRTVLDLRSAAERERTADPDGSAVGLAHHALPLVEFVADPMALVARFADVTSPARLGQWYAAMAEEAASVLVRGLGLVAAGHGGTLFFCSAGKDRTGVFAAAVLSVLGADDDVIVEDYVATEERMPGVLARLAAAHGVDLSAMGDLIDPDSPLLRAPGEAMATMLEVLRTRHGGLAALLSAAGLSADTVAVLRERLVA